MACMDLLSISTGHDARSRAVKFSGFDKLVFERLRQSQIQKAIVGR